MEMIVKPHRKSILAAWREASERDPQVTRASALSRVQFHDRIPEVLDSFERKLSARRRVDKEERAVEQQESAAAHGLHRWQQVVWKGVAAAWSRG